MAGAESQYKKESTRKPDRVDTLDELTIRFDREEFEYREAKRAARLKGMLERIPVEGSRAAGESSEPAFRLVPYFGKWTGGIVVNIASAVDAECNKRRGEAAGHLALAWNFAQNLLSRREELFEGTTPAFQEKLRSAYEGMLNRERLERNPVDYPDPITRIERMVWRTSHHLSQRDELYHFIYPAYDAAVVSNWFAKLYERFGDKS